MSASSSTDAWAVGNQLLEQWGGHAWKRFRPPGTDRFPDLSGIAAISPTDALVVDDDRGAIDRWNGSTWTTAATAKTGIRAGLIAVAASGPKHAWVVGTNGSQTQNFESDQPVTDHWNGSTLAEGVIRLPVPADLLSVAHAPASTTYWAVGWTSHSTPSGFFYETPRIERHC